MKTVRHPESSIGSAAHAYAEPLRLLARLLVRFHLQQQEAAQAPVKDDRDPTSPVR